ncbi:MAG: serpin family protein [Bacteroidetes bacterium]|nr:serpin family protein [Bacteroidota bacterium]
MKNTKNLGIIITIFAMLINISCKQKSISSTNSTNDNNIEVNSDMKQTVIDGNNKFAIAIMQNLKFAEENSIISPYSISTALAMTYGGARGKTMNEMANVMRYSLDQNSFHPTFSAFMKDITSISSEKAGFESANAIYAQKEYDFLQEFFDLINRNYGSALKFVDFHKGNREAIRQEINKWVEGKTKSKITDLIAPNILSEDTRMVLVNSIYFLAEWEKEFNKELTYNDSFYPNNGDPQKVKYMKTTDDFMYLKSKGYEAIELPYSGNKFSMMIVLPESKTDFSSFIKSFSYEDFNTIKSNFVKKQVEVNIPKYKIETATELQKVLIQMGMPLAFSNKADFSGMTGKQDLKIDKVIHKAFVEVDEKGTEAAAATAVVMIRKTAAVEDMSQKIIFKADRPFLFFIKENDNNTIIFMGSVINP